MQTAVQEINTEYDNKLLEIRNGTTYDVLEMSGSRAVWKEVLSVYSVKVNTDPDNPQEVATMDDSKKQLLKDIFWEMNSISSRTESKSETVITETDDGNGNIVQTETTVTRTYLYIMVSHNESFEEHYVSVPEQGGGKLIPEGMCNPGQVYTVSRGKSGMIGVFRLESQMLPGNGKFERTGIGSDRDAREATNTAFNFLKANGNRISGSISTTTRDYIINYQDLQGIGMTGKLALPSLIALCSIALGKPVLSSTAILGEISISGTIIKVDELANALAAVKAIITAVKGLVAAIAAGGWVAVVVIIVLCLVGLIAGSVLLVLVRI